MFNRDILGRLTVFAALWLVGNPRPGAAQMEIGALRVTLPAVAAAEVAAARVAHTNVAIMRLRLVDSVLRPILPNATRFDVSVESCESPNYLYDRSRRRVVLCTEMDGFARALVNASLGRDRVSRMEDIGDDDDAEDALAGFAVFAILHELGHAAIDQLRLSVPGNSEAAADDFAAYALLARGENGIVLGAARWLVWLEAHLASMSGDVPPDSTDHPLPGQRSDRLRCLVEGRMRLASASNESTNRLACQTEWLRVAGAWQELLGGRSGQ